MPRKAAKGVETSASAFGLLLSIKREEAGLSQEQLAHLLNIERSTLSKIETGDRTPRPETAAQCDKFLNTGDTFSRMHARINWRHSAMDFPNWFQRRWDLDRELAELREYQTPVAPGLLQTPDYARCLLGQLEQNGQATTESLLRGRLSRQTRFLEPGGPLLFVLMDESCIRNVVGGPRVMRDQLDHLLSVATLPNIRLQVVPFARDLAAPKVPMSLITMPNGVRWLYSESLTGAQFSNSAAVIAPFARTYDLLRADALSPRESAALISEAREGYDRHEHCTRSDVGTVAQEQFQRQRRRQLRRSGPRIHRRSRPSA